MSKIGIFSDIHGDDALDHVLARLASEGVSRYFVCGDVVGYGKYPNECCYRLQQIQARVVEGNHDWAVVGRTPYLDTFSKKAVDGVEYARQALNDHNIRWLECLPLYYSRGHMEFVHATLHEPETWPYLAVGSITGQTQWQDVQNCFDAQKGNVCFVGHSHQTAIFIEDNAKKIEVHEPAYENWIDLSGTKCIVDVGSISLPRDRQGAQSAAVYDVDGSKLKLITI
jgi:predicted phosphodiesterase